MTVLDPHTRTTAPTAHGLRAPAARPAGGQPGKGKRLHLDAPHNGPVPPPQYATAARKGTTLWDRRWERHHPRGTQPPQGTPAKGTVLGPHTRTLAPTARGRRTPAAPRGRAAGGGRAPGLSRPSQRGHPCYTAGRGSTWCLHEHANAGPRGQRSSSPTHAPPRP